MTAAVSSTHVRTLTRGTLIAACLAVLVGQVGLAIPAVLNGLFQSDLHTTSSQLTWISDAFLVPITLLELNFGVLGDLFGRKRLLVGGGVLMAIGELVAVLTPGVGTSTDSRVLVLWVGQVLAGIGAAALFPTSLAMIAAGTHTHRDRARSISIWAASLSAGGFVSPVLGGLTAKAAFGSDPEAGWRWAFLAVAILSLASAAVSVFLAENSSSPEGRSLDVGGQITIAVALFALLFAVIEGPTSGWRSVSVIGGFVVAALFLVLFVAAEQRSVAPLLNLDLFRRRAFTVAALVTVLGMFAFLGTAYTTSIRLSAIQGFSPLKTSLAFVLLQGMALLLAPVTLRVLERTDPKWALGAGCVLIAIGDFWMAGVSAKSLSIAPIVVPLILVGAGFAFAVSAVTAVTVNTVPTGLAGMASGATSLLRDFGFTLGPAVIGAVALSQAANAVQARLAANPSLQAALSGFTKTAPPPAVEAVNSGPLGANAVPGNPLQHVAFAALDRAYSHGYLVCGVSAALAALLALVVLGASTGHIAGESAVDDSALAAH